MEVYYWSSRSIGAKYSVYQIQTASFLFYLETTDPRGYAETYGTIVSNFADNLISVTRLTNNAISANTGFFGVILQQSKYNSEEFSRLGVNSAKVFNETSKEMASSNLFQLEPTESTQRK